MKVSTRIVISVLAGGIVAAASSDNTVLSVDNGNLTVALVRAPPANWPEPFWNKDWTGVKFNLSATVKKAIKYIGQAASDGANLVVFPELWFPGYPKGIDEAWIAEHAEDYYDNSLEIDSAPWNDILDAAKNNHIYVGLAYSEKTNQSIYLGQALISAYGELLHSRRKLRPSGIERYFWSDGEMDGLKVVNTPYGRWGLLECWEHFHPSMTFNMQAQLENVHLASFPYMPDHNESNALNWESLEVNGAAARTYAVNSGAVTLFTAVGYASVIGGDGLDIAEVKASVSAEEVPILYASINTTAFSSAEYDVDGEQSWGVLQQIEQNFPSHIPKVDGNLTKQNTVLVDDLLKFADAYKSSNGTATAGLP